MVLLALRMQILILILMKRLMQSLIMLINPTGLSIHQQCVAIH